MNPYSVLLVRPDYVSNEPYDTFLAWVDDYSVVGAVEQGRIAAAQTDRLLGEESPNPDDYYVLCVFEGHLNDVNPF